MFIHRKLLVMTLAQSRLRRTLVSLSNLLRKKIPEFLVSSSEMMVLTDIMDILVMPMTVIITRLVEGPMYVLKPSNLQVKQASIVKMWILGVVDIFFWFLESWDPPFIQSTFHWSRGLPRIALGGADGSSVLHSWLSTRNCFELDFFRFCSTYYHYVGVFGVFIVVQCCVCSSQFGAHGEHWLWIMSKYHAYGMWLLWNDSTLLWPYWEGYITVWCIIMVMVLAIVIVDDGGIGMEWMNGVCE